MEEKKGGRLGGGGKISLPLPLLPLPPSSLPQKKGGGLLLSTYKLLNIYLAIFDSRRFNWLISDGVTSNNHSYHIRTKFLGL